MRVTLPPAGLLTLCLALASCAAQPSRQQQSREQADYHYQLSVGHFWAQEIPFALRELLAALEQQPNHPEALFLMGVIYQGRRDYPAAEDYYRRALQANPQMYDCQNNLGTVLLAQSRWEEAEALYRELSRIPVYATPEHAHNNLGWALYNQSRYRESMEQFQLATEFGPAHCPAWNNLGMAHEQLQNWAETRRAWEMAVRQCARYPEPRYRLAVLVLQRDNDVARARALFQECFDQQPDSAWGLRCQEYLAALGGP
jgi:Tfp pilus assembly protein PilF